MRILSLLPLLAALLAASPAAAWELIMVERPGCAWCARWTREVGPVYARTDEGRRAPLRRVDIDAAPAEVTLRAPLLFTPTFVLADRGREIGRITGYADDGMFWGLLGAMIAKADRAADKGETVP
ncbi:hypothetical protein [Prosthecodimorpha staleyi]|uniref:Uncharacterized protein n=1 Tax=Prosthecodimorpha staleyi TaxID=2840188 RepID=A0A947D223_9HYPH|nr:hypothetical protein [Prosthecodimorpha staleyi]MBT9289530.1 hypothetical protein [Prosthecodimorpha staleyi]